eukprot:gene6591-7530_t
MQHPWCGGWGRGDALLPLTAPSGDGGDGGDGGWVACVKSRAVEGVVGVVAATFRSVQGVFGRSYGQFAVANKTWAVVPKQHCPNPYAAASVSAAANVSAAGYAYAAASVSANANAVAAANAASVGANATVDWCVMWIDRLIGTGWEVGEDRRRNLG